jgi:creatinine amidohydrolase
MPPPRILHEAPMPAWNLAETAYDAIKARPPYEIAVLPFGATEPHNLHLPYGTDTFQVDAIANRACALAADRGARIVRLPTIPYGTETNQRQFPLALNLMPSTIGRIVTDLVHSLELAGIHKLLLLNGHGGNDFKWLQRELYGSTPVHLFVCHWFRVGADRHRSIFENPGDHADEMETSLMLSLRPDLVRLEAADAGTMAPTAIEAVNRGWVEITRPWHLLTTNSGAGDPSQATADKGQAIADLVVERIAGFLVEASALPADASFPYRSSKEPRTK